MPGKRIYRCEALAIDRAMLCQKTKASASCLEGGILGGKCQNLDVSYARASKKDERGKTKAKTTQGRLTESAVLSASKKARLIHEVGTRCCYPNCRQDIALDIHHITPRSEGGSSRESNLVVLCPTHHRLARNGTIPRERLRLYSVKRVKDDNPQRQKEASRYQIQTEKKKRE